MVFTKTNGLNARGEVSSHVIFYMIVMIIVLVLVLYFTIPTFQGFVKQFFQEQDFAFTKSNVERAKMVCETTLISCMGRQSSDFVTALNMANTTRYQLCLSAVATTCEHLRLGKDGCNVTALKAGIYDISDIAEDKFIELCDQFYHDKIKCKYVCNKNNILTYDCVGEDGTTTFSKGSECPKK